MPPGVKRKRQSSHLSSDVRSSHSSNSQRVRFRRPSLTSQPLPQRTQLRSSHGQAGRRHETPQYSAASQARIHYAADDDEADENLDQIVMAIDREQKGVIGCAYYVAREEKLYCLQDVINGSLDAIETLKIDVRPTLVLLAPRVDLDDTESDAARRLRRSSLVDDVGEEYPLPYQVDVRPSQEFSYEGAKTKLINLESTLAGNGGTSFLVPGDASTYEEEQDHENFGSTSRQGKLLRLSSWIDFENRVGVGCVGAVITHLQRRRTADYLPDDTEAQWAFRVRSLEMLTLRNTMFINPDTLLSLQIIQPESHPSAFNQGPGSSGSKESLSVYGLFHHCARTPQGKARLRQTFLRPSLDMEDIDARLNFISVFARPDNLIPLQKLSKSMSRIKNIRTIMTHLHKGINGGSQRFRGFKSGVWATLLDFAYHTIDVRDTLREVLGVEGLPLVAKAMDVLDTRLLQNVGTSIHDNVDLDSSIEQNRTVVKRGVNDQLDDIKNIYDGMGDLLSRTATNIAQNLPDHIAVQLNVIYVPQLGYHITLPLDPDTGQSVYEGDPDDAAGGGQWERMFTTEHQAYLKDARMRAMDERLGDLWNMISDIEIEISYDLAQQVLQHEETLVAVSDICGELDCLFALAQGANQYKLVRPRMTEENIIDIKDCRHLLQETTVPSYVTNNAYLAGGRGRTSNNQEPSSPANLQSALSTNGSSNGVESSPTMLLLTGPNYSGKSIYLKSIAQTIYLAHLGSFVPCASALIGLTDALLTRIRTCETVSRPHSAFMIDLQQVAVMLKLATRRSLVVIDEFGKGTDGGDGAGLLAGVLKHLLARQVDAPKVLAATHFHEIFEGGFLGGDAQQRLAFKHMEVHVDRRRPTTTTSTSTVSATTPTTHTESDDIPTEVTYLYNLLPGRSTESYGTQCAAMNGVPMPIVERARRLGRLAAQGGDLVVSICAGVGSGEDEEALQDLEKAERVARRFLGRDFDGGEGEGVEGEMDVRRVLERLLVGEEGREGEEGMRMGSETETETRTETEPGS